MFPLWTAVPFVVFLLCLAVLPIVAGHFWHSNLHKGFVALGLSLPVLVYLPFHADGLATLVHVMVEYCEFIIPLAALYVIAGGIVVHGQPRPTPLTNTLFLACGVILANVIGTTGASVLLIRPMLRINRTRANHQHIPVFFIFAVSNAGGLLTPLGDPPLLLGFVHGVDFFWTLSLWPIWLTANGLILSVFIVWDWLIFRREKRETTSNAGPLRLAGMINFAFLAGVLASILFLKQPWSSLAMIGCTVLSLLFTSKQHRVANAFAWHAIIEVAVVFAGIFITMVPPLGLLQVHGQRLGLSLPWQFFWLTGLLSAFLDNAPTYLIFANLAAIPHDLPYLATHSPLLLRAISSGAVLMGALTYVGNAPNFMVKAIADASGYKTPSFFGYLLYSAVVLLPIFAAITLLYFWT